MGTSVHYCLAAPGDEVRWSCLSDAEPPAQGHLCLADMPTLIETVFVKCSLGAGPSESREGTLWESLYRGQVQAL